LQDQLPQPIATTTMTMTTTTATMTASATTTTTMTAAATTANLCAGCFLSHKNDAAIQVHHIFAILQ